jgi:hypothetical protein
MSLDAHLGIDLFFGVVAAAILKVDEPVDRGTVLLAHLDIDQIESATERVQKSHGHRKLLQALFAILSRTLLFEKELEHEYFPASRERSWDGSDSSCGGCFAYICRDGTKRFRPTQPTHDQAMSNGFVIAAASA